MERSGSIRRAGWVVMLLAACGACGCQTVKTPEEAIANSNIPTEFKKVSMPDYVVEPPDLILGEVLEALEGRPISGERLVRPDGKITLGFYGEVYVAGLTIPEVKEKIVLHLKKYLNDNILGLYEEDPKTGKPIPVDPKDTDRVFVDVSSYNSKAYYLVGAFRAPGRMVVTGSDTILDAIQYADGLADDADAEHVLLVREKPGPGQAKTEVVDVDALLLGKEGAVNHRLGNGDRLIAKRKPSEEGSRPEAAPAPRPAGRPGPADPKPNPYFPGGREPSLAGVQKQLERIEGQLDTLIKRQGRLEARIKKLER